jgi:dihydroxyacetone kinase
MPPAFLAAQAKPSNALAGSNGIENIGKSRQRPSKFQLSDSLVRRIITAGCEKVISEEPTITEYDAIVGDGDCGMLNAPPYLEHVQTVQLLRHVLK